MLLPKDMRIKKHGGVLPKTTESKTSTWAKLKNREPENPANFKVDSDYCPLAFHCRKLRVRSRLTRE